MHQVNAPQWAKVHAIIDGVDGRSHYVAIGKPVLSFAEGETTIVDGDAGLPRGAIVRIDPLRPAVRHVDRTIAAVAAANGGRYDVEAHLRHDPIATEAFAETHIRRLEALTGKHVVIYGQTEMTRDLIAAAPDRGLDILFKAQDVALHEIAGAQPFVTFTQNGIVRRLDADLIVGCDGFHGPSRKASGDIAARI